MNRWFVVLLTVLLLTTSGCVCGKDTGDAGVTRETAVPTKYILSFNENDNRVDAAAGYHILQVLVENQRVYEADAGKEDSLDVSLDITEYIRDERNIRICFRLYEEKAAHSYPISLGISGITLAADGGIMNIARWEYSATQDAFQGDYTQNMIHLYLPLGRNSSAGDYCEFVAYASPMADLALSFSDITYQPSVVIGGKQASIETTIHNIGSTGCENIRVDLLVDKKYIASQFLSLNANSSRDVQFRSDYGGMLSNIEIIIDPEDCIQEISTDNNKAGRIVTSLSHPYIFFDHSDIPALKEKIKLEPCKSWWQTVKSDADHALSIDFRNSALPQGVKAHYAHYLAFAYLLTDTIPYADKCTEALLNAKPDQTTPKSRIDYLHTTDALNRYLMSYDWIIDSGIVSSSQKEVILENLASLSEYLYQGLGVPLEDWRSAKGNERIRADAAIGLAALTLVGHSGSKSNPYDWLQFTLTDLFDNNGHIQRTITTDGVFVEGPSYGDYTFEALIPFAHSYKRLTGVDLLAEPRIHNYFDWLVKIQMPDGSMPTFDTGWRFSLHLQLVVAGDYDNGETYMLAWDRSRNLGYVSSYTYPLTQFIIYYDSSIGMSEPEWQPTQFLAEGGVAVFRSDWSKDATYMLVLAEHAPNISTHEQPDQSSFIMYARNTYMVIYPGDGRHYENVELQNWIRSAKAHNLILVDGEGPGVVNDYYRVKDPAHLGDHFITKCIDYAEVAVSYGNVDLSRKVFFPHHSYFVIVDDIEADSTHEYAFRLHFGDSSRGNLSILDNNIQWNTRNDYGDPVQLDVFSSVDTDDLSISTHEGPTDYYHAGQIFNHSYIDCRTNGEDVTFLTILYPTGSSEEIPVVQEIDVESGQALKLSLSQREDIIYANDSIEEVEIGVLKTDSRQMLASLINGSLYCFTITQGSSLSYHGGSMFTSTEIVTASFSYSTSSAEGVVQLKRDCTVYLQFENLQSVWVNDVELQPEKYSYNTDSGVLTLYLTSGTNTVTLYRH